MPLILAEQRLPGMSGTELLARVRDIFPTARRGLLITWGERSTPAPFLEAAALGQLEFYLNRPTRSPDEQFHRVITGSLEEWWRAFSVHAGATLHLDLVRGRNRHHIAESGFKALGLALRQATARVGGGVPSSKGLLG